MKRLIVIMIVAGAFLGGYYFGHQPGSPDLFAWIEQTYRQATQADKQTKAVANREPGSAMEGVTHGKINVSIGGKTYLIGPDDPEQPKPQPRR